MFIHEQGERLEDKVALLMQHTVSENVLLHVGAEIITYLCLHSYLVDVVMFVHSYTLA